MVSLHLGISVPNAHPQHTAHKGQGSAHPQPSCAGRPRQAGPSSVEPTSGTELGDQ